ncbi:NUDIX hydrolase [bacterium]|nr:NUDIX hydrolase [bacterium]
MYTYQYPRPALTADVVCIRDVAGVLEVLLIRRGNEPFSGSWALPGGFVEEWEAPEFTARRELAEETGVVWNGPVTLVGVFSKKGRDPRGWTIACAYVAALEERNPTLTPADDAADARWFPVVSLPDVAFDHHEIVAAALELL